MKVLTGIICWAVAYFPLQAQDGFVGNTMSLAAQAVRNGTQSDSIRRIQDDISQELNARVGLNADVLMSLATKADCARFLVLTQTCPVNTATADWILASPERLHLLVETLSAERDNIKGCFAILTRLSAYDRKDRDEYFELMLALCVVWDRPKRPPLHQQMGKQTLPYTQEIYRRYDYFKNLYSCGRAKMPYSRLGVHELIFVVDTPVPISELEWVCAHVDGQRIDWGDKFGGIQYDHARPPAMQYDWPHGEYTLDAIRTRGGICVDQAYYAVITARAYGIPAIYFRALGSSGGHAWFSFMKNPGEWVLDVGRSESKDYTTGYANHPQTNQRMTDHDVVYTYDQSLHSERFRQANAYVSIAEILDNDSTNRLRCAREARHLVEQYLRPWQIEAEVLIRENRCRELVDLFSQQQRVFLKYPDILVVTLDSIDPVLRQGGLQADAGRLRRSLSREIDGDRDDLSRMSGEDEVDRIIESGDMKKARRAMERLLTDHLDDGSKVFRLIEKYIELTGKSSQADASVRFLESYTDQLQGRFEFSPAYEQRIYKLMRDAYKNADDRKGIQRVELLIDE